MMHDGTNVSGLLFVVGVGKLALRGTVSGKVETSDSMVGRIEGEEIASKGREEGGTFGRGMTVAKEGDMIAGMNGTSGGEKTTEEVVLGVENRERVLVKHHF